MGNIFDGIKSLLGIQSPTRITWVGRNQSNTCVCCGKYIPEGRQVCPTCEHSADGYGRADAVLPDGVVLELKTGSRSEECSPQLELYKKLYRGDV